MSDYSDSQDIKDADYLRAWEDAPASFKARAAKLGIVAETEKSGGVVLEYDENLSRVSSPGHTPSFFVPDMAETLDTHVDRLIEKHGGQHEQLIRAVVEDLKIPMQKEIELNRASMLARVVMYLIKSESNNILARCHQLLHAIPRLAVITGYPSMRKSAKACGVSCEWVRRGRDKWCNILELPIPVDGRKSDEAKERYAKNGRENHWRHQVVQPQPTRPTPCLALKTKPPTLKILQRA